MNKIIEIADYGRGELVWFDSMPPTTYTNIAIAPDGALMPWRGVKATTHPPMLKTDGQFTWLPNRGMK